ncbi:MAG: hypothetical protein F2840_10360 [Actinobacteria bacterium]|nr:hypothetical protein [Actinomycetota bacterium]
MITQRFCDESPWLELAGYSRAVRVGTHIAVSGTTAHGNDGTALAPGDTYAQAKACLERTIAAAIELGASRDSILRTRMYLAPGADPHAAARAHKELLGDVAPANTTLFVGGLVGEGLMVEVELDAHANSEDSCMP